MLKFCSKLCSENQYYAHELIVLIRMLGVFCGCSIRVFKYFLYVKYYIQPRNRIKTISLTLKIQNGVICIMFTFSHCWHVYLHNKLKITKIVTWFYPIYYANYDNIIGTSLYFSQGIKKLRICPDVRLAWVFNSCVVGNMNKDNTIMVYYTRNDMSIVCLPNNLSTPVIRQQCVRKSV